MKSNLAEKPREESDCLFCHNRRDKRLAENDHAYSVLDSYPASEGHALVIPKRHAETLFDLTPEEALAIHELVVETRKVLEERFEGIDGYNVGANCYKAGGQSVPHCHVHVIPRRLGDVENPQGGVRHVIPGKGHYVRKKR